MRIIIEYEAGFLIEQVRAAQAAIQGGIAIGEIWGVSRDGNHYGVKRNEGSVRVYPQQTEGRS